MNQFAPENLLRLMAAQGLSIDEVVERTGLDRRTIQGILHGVNKPHARTLRRLADGLQVPADELFLDPSRLLYRHFDRHTNPLVEEVLASQPELFAHWTQADFDELHSRVGSGGPLTREGALAAAEQMNHKRELIEILSLLLETNHAEAVSCFLRTLYQQVRLKPG